MESLKHWATIFFARAVKQLDKNPEIYERKETEQVWQGRESHCYFGDNYFRESQRLDVPLYQSSNKRCIIQTQGGVNSAGKYIFMLWKYPWKITVVCSYLHRKKKEEEWTGLDSHCSGKNQSSFWCIRHRPEKDEENSKQRPGRTVLRQSRGLGIRALCCDLCTQTIDVPTFTGRWGRWGLSSDPTNKSLSMYFQEFMLLYIQMS